MIVTRLRDFLEQNGANYGHTTHRPAFTAREVAVADHLSTREVAKTIVFLGDGAYGMAVIPASTYLDLKELRELLGLSHLRLATEEELVGLFPDCELGAMPPFGNLYNMPVYVDGSLAREETIAFNAGTHRDVAHMKFREFERLAGAKVISFSRAA
ncbi:MAG: YbaK/EbsC family protein [Acidobacteria bacterium]|nr:YbaK/EbsC family protein [Acidobacteriota bacterium]MBI3471020.1 YbaK/EbsC family protein [Candidatus Solibacter usitatus]